MKNFFISIALIFIAVGYSFSDERGEVKYWIFFKDKGEALYRPLSFAKGSAFSLAAEEGLSLRAMERRKKVSKDNPVDYLDLPVNNNYIRKVVETGVEIKNVSKWFNAVTAYLNDAEAEKIRALPFVLEVRAVAVYKGKKDIPGDSPLQKKAFQKIQSKYKYGFSAFQNNMINVPLLHDIGIDGQGVYVGMLDTGFDWRKPSALNKRKVKKEYDFIFNDSITANQAIDAGNQDGHGTLCFSVLGGFAPDTLIGPAYNAEFILAKTEDVRSETKIEEDNWVSAIEWMEREGVDVVSSSLGYNEFNNNIGNYTYKDMNGETAIVTLAADIAVTKGVTIVVSAGNEGNVAWKYITAPGDGKNVITVGAALSTGARASFSSMGPTYDGRIKPDVSALGVSVYHSVSGTVSGYSTSNGTSLSCPLVAGVVALVISARPELTPTQVRDALRNTASLASTPNNELGWGIIDAYKAVTYHGLVFSNRPFQETLTNSIKISTYIASRYTINKSSVKIYYSLDNVNYISMPMTQEINLDETNSGLYSVSIPVVSGNPSLNYYISASDEKGERKNPVNAPDKSFTLLDAETARSLPGSFLLYQNYPNPFNPATEIKFDIKQKTNVKLNIYNSLGQLVQELLNEVMNPDTYTVSWNGLDINGRRCSSGVYYYRIETDNYSETKKMSLIK